MIIFSHRLSSTDLSTCYWDSWWEIQNNFYFVSFNLAFKLSQSTLTCKFKFNYSFKATNSPNSASYTHCLLISLTSFHEWPAINVSNSTKLKPASWYSFAPFFPNFFNLNDQHFTAMFVYKYKTYLVSPHLLKCCCKDCSSTTKLYPCHPSLFILLLLGHFFVGNTIYLSLFLMLSTS